ncbi:MAG: hypothetical protein PHR11_03725, partial [Candidatus Omnitrophica bacterium]|nr:hypothetical protein [Candidatus Omnitrophota bacterium]
GIGYKPTERLDISVFVFYLNAFERPVGTWDGEGKYLSRELGYEADLYIDYVLNPHATIEFLAGYFIPGKFYRTERDDTGGSVLSPYIRGDGKVDHAYQVELCMALRF